AAVAAPDGVRARPDDRAAGALRVGEDRVDVLRAAHVVRQLDAGRPMAAEGGPQAENHAARLKEADLVIGLLRTAPPHRLIEGSRAREVGHSEGDQADARFHTANDREARARTRA